MSSVCRAIVVLMTGADEPELIVAGQSVAFGPLRADLAGTYARWLNDLDVRYGVQYLGIATSLSELEWIEETARTAAGREPKEVAFTVYDVADRAAVGMTSLSSMSHLHGTATLGVVLGERRGQGLGTAATRLLLDWGFHVLGLRNIVLETPTWNRAAIRAYENAGFRPVGIRRQAALSRGVPSDVLLMDAVRDEFTDSVLAR
jgi:diamine N-acetyltransferase